MVYSPAPNISNAQSWLLLLGSIDTGHAHYFDKNRNLWLAFGDIQRTEEVFSFSIQGFNVV